MSAPDDPEGAKGPKTQPEAENETGQEASVTGTEKPDAEAAPAEKKSAPEGAKRAPRKSQRKAPDLTAEKPSPGEKAAESAASGTGSRRSRRMAMIAAGAALVLVGGPALFLLCLSQSVKPVDVSLSPNGAPVACAEVAGHFTDCYLSEEVTVSAPSAAAKTGFDQFCCDFIVERKVVTTAAYSDGSGVPPTLDADSTDLPLADGTRRTGRPVLHDGGDLKRNIRLVSQPEFTVPALGGLERLLGGPVPFDVGKLVASVMPDAAARFETERTVPLTMDGTTVRITSAGQTQISVQARTRTSLLFGNLLTGDVTAGDILTAEANLPAAASGSLAAQIDSLAPAGHGRIRAALATLRQVSVSRVSADDDATAGLQSAGNACIDFYEAMRAQFNRYDASVATYIAALSTGLLTSRSPVDLHGCRDANRPNLSADLSSDWTALNAPFDELSVPEVKTPEEPASDSMVDNEETVRRLLLSLASAAKSGARLQDMKKAIADPVAINFGRDGSASSGSREAVIRMLYRQWSHVGCWIYAATPSGGSAMLLAEAQYPYLNRIVLGFDEAGRVERVEVSGVTFDDLIRFKAANRGSNCQDFLNPVRLADYRDWYADNPVGTPTPSDHAERLFSEGLQQKFRLN